MLCETCREREATVHFSVLSGPSNELSSHLCDSCYPQAEAAQSYHCDPATPLLLQVENITAPEFLELSAKAAANGADKPAYHDLFHELERFPANRERLSIELLEIALESLRNGEDPRQSLALATCLGSSAGPRRREYIDHLEDVILRLVDLMAKSPKTPSPQRLGLGLSLAALALRKADENRYTKILTSLKRKCGGRAQNQMTTAVLYMEGKMPVLLKSVVRSRRKPARG